MKTMMIAKLDSHARVSIEIPSPRNHNPLVDYIEIFGGDMSNVKPSKEGWYRLHLRYGLETVVGLAAYYHSIGWTEMIYPRVYRSRILDGGL